MDFFFGGDSGLIAQSWRHFAYNSKWTWATVGEFSWKNVLVAEKEEVRREGNFGNSLYSITWSYENNHNQFSKVPLFVTTCTLNMESFPQ